MAFVHTIIRPSIDRIDRSRKRLGVALHFGGKRAGLSRMGETSALRRYCADRQRHDRNAMELSPSVLTDKITRFPIRFRVRSEERRVGKECRCVVWLCGCN